MTIIPTPRTPLMLFAEDDHEDWILIRDTLQDYTD